MSGDRVRESFEGMEAATLLATMAFVMDDYTQEVQAIIREVAGARGIGEVSIRRHREACYPDGEFEFNCERCNCELLLGRDDFINAMYVCPECNSHKPLPYSRIRPSDNLSTERTIARGLAKLGLTGTFVALELHDSRKRAKIREAILDGTFWDKLRLSGNARSSPDDDLLESPPVADTLGSEYEDVPVPSIDELRRLGFEVEEDREDDRDPEEKMP